MPSRHQLMAHLGVSDRYEEAGAAFGIPPGLAYMIMTGLPADGSDVLTREELEGRTGLTERSTQVLVNPPTDLPKHKAIVEEWMRGRVAADPGMRRAGQERTATPPEIQGEGETDDVVSVIGWQHNQVKYIQEQLETVPGVKKGGDAAKQEQRVSLVDMIRVRLSRHETAEEEHFWPAVRDRLGDGDSWADQARDQEQQGKDLLQALMGVDGGDPHFDELVEELVAALRKHVAFEDMVLLHFSEEVPEQARRELGSKVQHAYGSAPTRPHPHAPDEGTALEAAAALAAPLDRMRDRIGHRPAEREGQAEGEPTGGTAGPKPKPKRAKKKET